MLSADEFRTCMSAGNFEERIIGTTAYWVLNEVLIVHTQGDAADLKTLRSVMRANKFESAIVMGTMASVDLPSHSQDTRVLQTMLLLRKTHSELYPETPLHVVGENCLDSTAVLALAPKSVGSERKDPPPDFVNTQ